MNERVMQFRIGMFVIVAGLVLTMLIVWFGESPSLFRDNAYLTVHFDEAPGVAEGIPVRKSGIRIGEVAAIQFDDRPNHPDGVLVTLALERKYKLRAGSTPRITRALIGDVAIDMMPGTSTEPLKTHDTATIPPDPEIVEGQVAPDPSKAMEAATGVIQDASGTLRSIDAAAKSLATLSKKAENLDQMIVAWRDMGNSVRTLSDNMNRVVVENEGNFGPAMANFKETSQKLNQTLDPTTLASLRDGVQQFASASKRLDKAMADFAPLAEDLGGGFNVKPKTRFGRVVYDLGLLTQHFEGPKGTLNPNGSLQRLVLETELYDNLNQAAGSVREVFSRLRPAADDLRTFSRSIAKDPGTLMRGALSR